jgi:uncharacterized protein (TIGR03067 family)
MLSRLLPLMVVVGIGIALEVQGQDAKKDLEKFQGDWAVTSMVRGENSAPKELIDSITFTFMGDKMTMSSNEGVEKRREFTIKLDPSKKPSAIDATPLDGPHKGKLGSGIYQLTGNDLKIYIPNKDGKERPTDFKPDAAGDYVLLSLVRKRR